MKKILLSFFVVIISAGYIAYQYIGGNSVSASVPSVATQLQTQVSVATPVQTKPVQTTPTPTQTTTPTPVTTPTPTPAPKPKGQYIDGTYTGSAADAYYGMIQVQAIIQGGKLVTVNFLQYPNDRSTSRYINTQAMPELKSEAIAAQSANVSGVSGATDTSQAFTQSLGDALAQAKNS